MINVIVLFTYFVNLQGLQYWEQKLQASAYAQSPEYDYVCSFQDTTDLD